MSKMEEMKAKTTASQTQVATQLGRSCHADFVTVFAELFCTLQPVLVDVVICFHVSTGHDRRTLRLCKNKIRTKGS